MNPFFQEQLDVLQREHPGAMIVLLDGIGDYIYASDDSMTLLGYTPEEMVGRHALDFAAYEDISHIQVTIQDALLTGESVTVNIRVRTKSGELRPARGGIMRLLDPNSHDIYLAGWVVAT